MASNLLKTFKKIDIDRKLIIQLLNSSGLSIPENGSFSDIIDALTTFELPNEFNINIGWVRPSYWPDSKEILNNAPSYEGYFPYAVALMDNTLDSVILPLSKNVITKLIYTSDGVTYRYNNVDEGIEHTWDKTKDIIIDENNPMRYVVLYGDLSKVSNYGYPICYTSGSYNDVSSPIYKANKEDKGWGNCIVEWLLDLRDNIPTTTFSSTYRTTFPCNHSDGKNSKVASITISETVGKKIKTDSINNSDYFYNLRYLNTYANANNSGGFNDTNLYTYINTGSNTHNTLGTRSTVTYMEITNIINLANTNSYSSGSPVCTVRLPNTESLDRNCSISAKTIYAPKLKMINNSSLSISSNILYLPSLETAAVNILSYIIPIVILPNLKTLNSKIASNQDRRPAHTIIVPSLSSISDKEAFNFEGLINLEVGNGFNSSINLNKTILSKTSILNLFDNLAEVPTDSGLTVTLGSRLLYYLTEEEKAIATNKGWVLN